MKKKIKIFVIDIILAGICLCTFALFHHVIPKKLESENIIINSDEDICSCTNENVYSCELVSNDTSYKSNNISVEINSYNEDGIIYHVADVYIKNIESFQTVFADDTYGKGYTEWITNIDKRSNSIITINGDFYGLTNKGIVIRNGVLYRSTKSSSDVLVLYKNGVLKTYGKDEYDVDKLIENSAYQTWSFGPELLDDEGHALTKFNSTVTPKNPRTAIGYIGIGHYIFVTVEGRSNTSSGMTLKELADLFEKLGCTSAYNLDGGTIFHDGI